MNNVFSGNAVSKGIAVGEIAVIAPRPAAEICEFSAQSAEQNTELFRTAQQKAAAQLEDLAKNAGDTGLAEAQALFEVHAELCTDPDFTECAEALIAEGKSPAYAVRTAGKQFAEMFSALEDAYLRERSRDVLDVANRICDILCGDGEGYCLPADRCIIVAEDLTPSQTLLLDRNKIAGFALLEGSPLAHTAMLARSLGIPCLMNLSEREILTHGGEIAVLDGNRGVLHIQPDTVTLDTYRKAEAEKAAEKAELLAFRDCECTVRDGRHIGIYCNISSLADTEEAVKVGAEGVGLCRSEFLFPDTVHAPTEEEQFCMYRRLLHILAGRELTVRTFDIGSDKKTDWLSAGTEANPALGVRGIRLTLAHPDVLRVQLRALLRASAYGKIRIMLPMVSDTEEITAVKAILAEIKADLERENIAYSDTVPLGIMVETPAAAVMSDILAQHVDFFSIGTNDLTQYTLAADRQNSVLSKQFTHRHEAVLRLISLTAENAEKYNIPVSVCGEAAADFAVTERLTEAGVTALSVPPAVLLSLKKHLITE